MKNYKLLIDAGCEYIYPIEKPYKLDKLNYKSYIYKINKITDLNYSSVTYIGRNAMGENSGYLHCHSMVTHGFKNFYINDSSLICNKLLNPQGTVMAVAWECNKIFK